MRPQRTRRRTAGAFAGALFAVCPVSALAQDYPTRPVRIVVGSPAGGGGDTMARLMAQRMTPVLGQQVIIDNRPGAGGNVGAEIVARSPPDGYTLLFVFTGHVTSPSLFPKLPFDTERDFAGITQLAANEAMLLVHPSLPVKTVRELIALAKQNPGKYSMGAIIAGSNHLGSELFKLQAGVDLLFVPYKGNATALTDLLGGQLQVMFNQISVSLPHVKSGKLRALAAAGPRRSKLAPDLPTVSEAGVPGFSFNGWYGFVAPAKVPRAIILKLNRTSVDVVRAPENVERITGMGNEPVGSTPEAFDQLIRDEIPKWAKVIREAKITLTE